MNIGIMLVLLAPSIAAEPAPASPTGIGVISPKDAKALIENPDPAKRPLVLDTRGDYKDYFRGHLPTAHHINFDTLRGTDNGVPVQYLPEDLTRTLLIRAGVDKDRLHILYAQGAKLPNDEILSSSMVAFVLEKYSIKNIRIVDGGVNAYRAAFPVSQEYPKTPAGKLPKEMNPKIALDVNDVLKLKGQPGHILVDARPKNEYEGDDIVWLRKGHIPGAVSFHWARLMADDNTHLFRPVEECKKKLAAEGITPDKDVLVYCGTSREGSLLRFILKHHLGYPKVRLYEGSWKEYVNLKDLPVEAGPGPKR
jgi:thiosulfate/3-mercaptopyruvate sulfurtransferase